MDGKHFGAYPHVGHDGLQVLDRQRQFLSMRTHNLGYVTSIAAPGFSEVAVISLQDSGLAATAGRAHRLLETNDGSPTSTGS
jgi:hypothetical protein